MKLKKSVSILLTLLMVISCIPLSASSLNEVWDGTADTEWAGEGTEEDPYQISTAQELAGFSQQINSGNNTYAHYILTNDITLNVLTDLESWGTYDENDEIIAPANSWTPIGNLSEHLSGSFDGDGHTVRGIYINSGHDYHGLFGYSEGTIKNLGVADSYIYGYERVGGIVSNSYGELINCYSSATVKGNFYVGGLAAHANKATDCYNTGKVSGSDYVGGVAGIGNYLTNCYSTGTVSGNSYCGGIVGNCNGETVASYYLSGTATVGINGPSGCGTVDSLTQEEMKLRESYEGWNFNNVWELGYIEGYAFPTLRIFGSRDMKYSVKFVSEGETVSEELLASNAEITAPVPDENDTYDFAYWKNGSMKYAPGETITVTQDAVFTAVWAVRNTSENVWDGTADIEWDGTGTQDDPYQIATAKELAGLSQQTAEGNTYLDEYFILTSDILLNDGGESFTSFICGKTPWTPIDNFHGSFDGKEHTVSGMYIDSDKDYQGLFANCFGTLKNLGTINSFVQGDTYVGGVVSFCFEEVTGCYNTGTVVGYNSVGGVVGSCDTVEKCYNTGDISGMDSVGGVVGMGNAENCHNSGKVNARKFVGGVVGISVDTVSSCYSTGDISGVEKVGGVVGYGDVDNSYNTGAVSGDIHVGGNVGVGNAEICYNTGEINGDTSAGGNVGYGEAEICYNTGTVSGGSQIGGVVGYGGALNCYNTGIVNSTEFYAGGVVGFTSEETAYCYNAGKVNGSTYVGGVTGFDENKVTACYYLYGTAIGGIEDTDFSGKAQVLTQEELKLEESFTGWNFNSVWETGYSHDYFYPTLRPLGSLKAKFDVEFVSEGNSLSKGLLLLDTKIISAAPYENATYDFAYWKNGNMTYAPGEIIKITADAVYTAVWTVKNTSENVWDGTTDIEWEGTGTQDNPYQIATAAELAGLSQQTNEGETYTDKYFMLTADIMLNDGGESFTAFLSGKNHWVPIDDFDGSFDGNGHTVSGIYISTDSDYQGLFGSFDGEVKNLSIADSYISGGLLVGGVAGLNGGTISACQSSAKVYGTNYVGGITGSGNVDSSCNTGTVSGKDNIGGVTGYGETQYCYNTGAINGNSDVGGIVGDGTANLCYNVGNVSGVDAVGAIVGSSYGTVSSCYYLDTCTSMPGIFGTALTSEQMKNAASFVGFDFTDKWEFGAVDEGYLYPTLKDAGNVFICYVTFLDYDGVTVLSTVPVKNGEGAVAPDMSKKSFKDSDYTYEFEKWDVPFSEVTENLVVKAVYKKTENKNAGELFAERKLAGLKASYNTSTSVKLTWTAVEGATGYQIYKYNGKSYVYYRYSRTNSFTDTALTANSAVYYKVRAYMNYSGRNYFTALSSFVKTYTAPAKVSGLKVSVYANTALKLTWTKVSGATAYRVYMYNPKTRAYVGYKNTTSNILTVSSLKAGTQYYFKVRAYRTIGGVNYWGDYSNFIKTATRPLNTAITSVSSPARGRLTVNWRASAGAAGYLVQYSTSRNFSGAVTRYVRGTSYTATGLTSGRIYYVRVRPYVLMGTSKIYSPSVSSYRYIKTK